MTIKCRGSIQDCRSEGIFAQSDFALLDITVTGHFWIGRLRLDIYFIALPSHLSSTSSDASSRENRGSSADLCRRSSSTPASKSNFSSSPTSSSSDGRIVDERVARGGQSTGGISAAALGRDRRDNQRRFLTQAAGMAQLRTLSGGKE